MRRYLSEHRKDTQGSGRALIDAQITPVFRGPARKWMPTRRISDPSGVKGGEVRSPQRRCGKDPPSGKSRSPGPKNDRFIRASAYVLYIQG